MSSRLTSGFRRVGMLANSTKPLLDVSLQKLGLPLRTHSGRRGQHPQWWWHRGPLELRAGKVLNHTAKELKDQLSRSARRLLLRTEVQEARACSLHITSFLAVTVCRWRRSDGSWRLISVMGQFRAADAFGRPMWTMLSLSVHRIVSACLTRTGSCQERIRALSAPLREPNTIA